MTQNTTTDMMGDLFNSDPTNFEETPFHLITTDHPYMAMIGLSAFTTGTLYRWIHQKNGRGELANAKYFNEDSLPFSVGSILLGDTTADFGNEGSNRDKSSNIGKGQFAFQAWRKEDDTAAGQYYTKYADSDSSDLWNFVQGGLNEAEQPRSYSYANLKFNEFDDKFVTLDGEIADADEVDFEVPDGNGGKESITFAGVSPITNLIALNDYANRLELENIDKSSWTTEQFARSEFILDIQSSKEGYVEFSGYIPFQVSLSEGDDGDTFECFKPDWVKYRLYLYPKSAPKSTRRGIAMAKPTFAGPPVDALGRKYQRKEDGRFAAFPEGSASSEVVAELDITYNEYTGKWEAGSKQMVAVVVQQIEPAQAISAERVKNLSPEEMLKSPQDPNSHIIWGSGAATPFSMQNANPQQWTPNYAQASELDEDGKFTIICPKETGEKATLRVFNASSKALEVDQYVLLNQIDGLWFAIDFPSGIPSSSETESGFDGLWEFQYVATNVVNYFRDKDFDVIRPSLIQQNFHRNYYYDDPLNQYTYEGSQPLDNVLSPGGFHQFTSWDFMDNKIAGTREGFNAYSLTDPVVAPNGDSLIPVLDSNGDEYPTLSYGVRTGGFFGCIFPDGYNTQEVAEYKVERNFVATPTISTSSINSATNSWDSTGDEGELIIPNQGGNPGSRNSHKMVYFHSDGIQKSDLPFSDGDARNGWKYLDQSYKDSTGDYINMFYDKDLNLTNLPADIALNASPYGAKNGQPLSSIHFIEAMYQSRNYASRGFGYESNRDCHDNVVRFFSEGQNWLYRKYDDDSPDQKDFTESNAFDFQPIRPNRIIFRPLKAEAYAQFGEVEFDADTATNSNPNWSVRSRQGFNQAISSRLIDKKRPSSKLSYKREFDVDVLFTPSERELKLAGTFGEGPNGYDGVLYQLYQSKWGLQHNVDIPLFAISRYTISPNAQLEVGGRFPEDCWGYEGGNQWCHGASRAGYKKDTDTNYGINYGERTKSGGVGIIGAVASFRANKSVKFSADCYLGTHAWNYINLFDTFYSSWGGDGDAIDSYGTTALFAKIYHKWPRQQTIYDSRYFAVHHFNAGILGETDSQGKYTNRVEIEKITQTDPTNENGGQKQYDYEIHQSDYDIDIRIPSVLQKIPNELSPNVLKHLVGGPGTIKTYKNRAVQAGEVYETVPYNKWDIDTQRRGKLLPYSYYQHYLAIPSVKVSIPRFNDGKDTDGVEQVYKNGGYAVIINLEDYDLEEGFYSTTVVPFYDVSSKELKEFDPLTRPNSEDVVMIIKNPGSGPKSPYKKGDTFVTNTANSTVQAIIEVVAVEGYNTSGSPDDGRISELKVSFEGIGFGYSGFSNVDEDTPINNITTGMSLTGGGSQPPTGGGFNAYLVRGTKVQKGNGLDHKPELATSAEQHRLSIRSLSKGESSSREDIGPIRDLEEQEIVFDNKSSDNNYDVFFHFHNDISHTFMLGRDPSTLEWQASANRPKGEENWIDLEITTD